MKEIFKIGHHLQKKRKADMNLYFSARDPLRDCFQVGSVYYWILINMNSMKLVTFYFMKKDLKQFCDTVSPESIHTKDESKRCSAFSFIFGVN